MRAYNRWVSDVLSMLFNDSFENVASQLNSTGYYKPKSGVLHAAEFYGAEFRNAGSFHKWLGYYGNEKVGIFYIKHGKLKIVETDATYRKIYATLVDDNDRVLTPFWIETDGYNDISVRVDRSQNPVQFES